MFGVLVYIAIFAIFMDVPEVFALKPGECILPPYPENGNYVVAGNSTAKPGDILEYYVLKVTCDPGYHSEVEDPKCLRDWFSELPKCIPLCQWKSAGTVSCGLQETCYMDSLQGSGGDLRSSQRSLNDDECGKVPPEFNHVVSGGKTAETEELPWHAGIYSKLFTPYMQICGGSLVSSTVVISAGHCFWDDLQKQLPAENYAVAVGKIYRPWNDPHDELAQKSDVQEIRIPTRFLGSATNFQEDLALLVLRDPVSFTKAVRPVCINFDFELDKTQLRSGSMGKVGGWGLRAQDGRPSPTLQVALIPSIDIARCIAGSDPAFRTFLSGDKICAGYTNGTAVCKGDSGGGLSFPLTTDKGTRFYLRGVVSAAPKTDHLCSVYHWATFTHLLRHQHFIEAVLGAKSQVEPQEPARSDPMLMFTNQRSHTMPDAKPTSVWV